MRTSMAPVTQLFKHRYNHHSTTREDASMPETPASQPSPELPLPPSSLVEEVPGGVRIAMRAERSGCLITFLTAWVFGWSIGAFLVARDLLAPSDLTEAVLLTVWLVSWVGFGVAAAGMLAFVLDGREILTIDGGGISRRAEVFGIGRTWRWSAAAVSNFRADGAFLSFDANGKHVRTGTNLTTSSAERIAEELVRRFPGLG